MNDKLNIIVVAVVLTGIAVAAFMLAPHQPAQEVETHYPTGTLSCAECEEVGQRINLWDSPDRNRVVGSLAHNTEVSIIMTGSGPDGRTYYLVEAYDRRGWVPRDFVAR